MAKSLASNSFVLTTTTHSTRLTFKNPRLTVVAKRSGPFPPLRRGKQAGGDDSTREESGGESSSSNFFGLFNFGKLSEANSFIPVASSPPALLSSRRKDPGTVFVAGATGQVGARIAQTLLREGFKVRAGVPELDSAQELARFAAKYKIISNEESKRLNAVESTFQDAESIAKAIGNASKVVVTIGPLENGATAEVTTSDALQVVEAAQLAGVGHVAIIYDESVVAASTYNVLDGISSFFSNLFSKSQPLTLPEFLQKVVETDVRYTLVKTRLTDDFLPESSYNVVVAAEGNGGANDYKVSKSRMALLVAGLFSNTAVAENKVVEVYTDPSAPSRPVHELFSAIPEDGRRKAYAEALAKAKAEEEAIKASEMAREAAEAAKKLKEEVKKLSEEEARATSLAEEAKQKAEVAGTSVENVLNKAKDFGSGISWEKLSSQLATAVQKPIIDPPKVQIATARGQAKARTLPAQKATVRQLSSNPLPMRKRANEEPKVKGNKQAESKPEMRNIFGGLFKQETIYVDDD
ncbi:hypothetical protein Nepgr_014577 [Nepenthes gracilis]|uniref:NAD(P)-binding domain-containing protein n=1 Tax=Nepenthes gracilis TaxID=150966 RepID=A0AAD3XQG0_NEPGR|nr:hypothetical protein Nepgr_014577 [Nepenthes gracilis]